MIELSNTTSSKIAATLVQARKRAGSPMMGMVLTMVIVVPKEDADQALADARQASREHPARVIAVILGDRRGSACVDATIITGSEGWSGETAVIELRGEVCKHPDSVVLPLLLPDSPVVVWWPVDPPKVPGEDPLGRLAQRRITDAAAATTRQKQALKVQCEGYNPGNTDLAWPRTTSWRALLASALDQFQSRVLSAEVEADATSPSGELLGAWLSKSLKVPLKRSVSPGPGITKVTLETKAGPICIARDGQLATFRGPGRSAVPVALKRRGVAECLAEELRRLDEDEVYAATVKHYLKPAQKSAQKSAIRRSRRSPQSVKKS